MKKNKKKLLIVLSILLVLLIALVITLRIINNINRAKLVYGYEVMGVKRDPVVESNMKKTIAVSNSSVLQNFRGETPVSSITKRVKEVFLTNIPLVIEETNNMSNEELIKYFNNNEKKISEELAIENETSFLNMVSKFRELKSDLFEDCMSCEFVENNGMYLKVYYANDEMVECKIIGNSADYISFEF